MSRLVVGLALFLIAAGAAAQPGSEPEPEPSSAERDRGWFTYGAGLGSPYDLVFSTTANFGRTRVLQVGAHGIAEFT